MKRLAQDHTKGTQYLMATLDFIYLNIWFAGREGLTQLGMLDTTHWCGAWLNWNGSLSLLFEFLEADFEIVNNRRNGCDYNEVGVDWFMLHEKSVACQFGLHNPN